MFYFHFNSIFHISVNKDVCVLDQVIDFKVLATASQIYLRVRR